MMLSTRHHRVLVLIGSLAGALISGLAVSPQPAAASRNPDCTAAQLRVSLGPSQYRPWSHPARWGISLTAVRFFNTGAESHLSYGGPLVRFQFVPGPASNEPSSELTVPVAPIPASLAPRVDHDQTQIVYLVTTTVTQPQLAACHRSLAYGVYIEGYGTSFPSLVPGPYFARRFPDVCRTNEAHPVINYGAIWSQRFHS